MEENTTPHFEVVSLSAYTSPRIEEIKRDGWVEYGRGINDDLYYNYTGQNYGQLSPPDRNVYDNDYFQYLIDRYSGSATNGAIINSISRMIYGKGLAATDASKNPEGWAKLLSMLPAKDLRKICFDFKLHGMAAIQVSKSNGKPQKLTHWPIETLRSGIANDKGEVKEWYYHPKWSERKRNEDPKRFAAWGHGGRNGNEMYVIKPYVSGFYYYSPPDYCGGLAYAVLEEDIADYLINDVKNHFSGTTVVNFNNGNIPDERERRKIKNDVQQKLTGALGDKLIISFNANQENQTTVEKIPLDNAPDHYQYLSDECFEKLIEAHRVTSPMLLGIRSGNEGLGNNAEEIETATKLMYNLTVKPLQDEILDAINEIIVEAGLSFNLFFKSLQPLDWTDYATVDKEEAAEEGVELSADEERHELTDEEYDEVLNSLQGEVIDDQWECLGVRECNDKNEPTEEWIKKWTQPKQNLWQRLAGAITGKPSEESRFDSNDNIYKIRFSYQERYSKANSRGFCQAMMRRTRKGVVYRYEDIVSTNSNSVNPGMGHNGRPYNLFKYKGGVNCGHYWQEEFYRRKKKADGEYYEDKALSSSEQVNSIPADEYSPSARQKAQIAEAFESPIDTPRRGRHPNS